MVDALIGSATPTTDRLRATAESCDRAGDATREAREARMTPKPNRRFYLGTRQDGRLFIFTDMGEFKTEQAARDYWHGSPRNGRAVIVEHWDARRTGSSLTYGTNENVIPV